MPAPDAKPVLQSPRLRLRAPAPPDAPRIAELASDPDIARMTTRMPYPYGLKDAEAFIERTLNQDLRRDVTFLVESQADGPVGMLGFFTEGPVGPELGYWIGRPCWGRGYATEAAATALDWAHRSWGKRAIVAGFFTDNAASGRVLEKTGFLHTGVVESRWSEARGAEAPTRLMVRIA
ncbi:MAG: GNAT family N-acetyltransferase [Pseudomonadota bacterium]|nr:GNAT family N-acetyltransferase [Pseudomonadota bacterium]